MTTSDGISTEDWDRVHDLALAVVNAEDGSDDEHVCRETLLAYLAELEERYGPRPSILATRADYLTNDTSGRIDLLQRAYALASEVDDIRNQFHIAASLAAIYVEDLRDPIEGEGWLRRATHYLVRAGDDVDRRECARLEERLRRLIDSHD